VYRSTNAEDRRTVVRRRVACFPRNGQSDLRDALEAEIDQARKSGMPFEEVMAA
jgi:hypothetical protein